MDCMEFLFDKKNRFNENVRIWVFILQLLETLTKFFETFIFCELNCFSKNGFQWKDLSSPVYFQNPLVSFYFSSLSTAFKKNL